MTCDELRHALITTWPAFTRVERYTIIHLLLQLSATTPAADADAYKDPGIAAFAQHLAPGPVPLSTLDSQLSTPAIDLPSEEQP